MNKFFSWTIVMAIVFCACSKENSNNSQSAENSTVTKVEGALLSAPVQKKEEQVDPLEILLGGGSDKKAPPKKEEKKNDPKENLLDLEKVEIPVITLEKVSPEETIVKSEENTSTEVSPKETIIKAEDNASTEVSPEETIVKTEENTSTEITPLGTSSEEEKEVLASEEKPENNSSVDEKKKEEALSSNEADSEKVLVSDTSSNPASNSVTSVENQGDISQGAEVKVINGSLVIVPRSGNSTKNEVVEKTIDETPQEVADPTEKEKTEENLVTAVIPVEKNIEEDKTENTTEEENSKKSLPKKLDESLIAFQGKGYNPMSFQFLASYDMPELPKEEDAKNIPGYIEDLNGQSVALPGYMIPFESYENKIRKFILVRSHSMCCFGAQPMIHEFVYVEMEEDQSAVYFPNIPVAVFGTFQVEKKVEDGILLNIYKMKARKVISPRDYRFLEILKKMPKIPSYEEE